MNHIVFSHMFFDHHFDWKFWTYVMVKINFSKIAFLSKYCTFQWIVILISSCFGKGGRRGFYLAVTWRGVLLTSLSHWGGEGPTYLVVAWGGEEVLLTSLSHERGGGFYLPRCRMGRRGGLTNLQLVHSLQGDCESCESCNNYRGRLRIKISLCGNAKMQKV